MRWLACIWSRMPVPKFAMAAQGARVKASWNLHPPTFKALGLDRKIRVGAWFTAVLYALRAMKWVRGTPLDPFGRTKMRRLERDLVSEYEAVLASATGALTTDNFATVVDLVSLPEHVRGYESVKEANVERYRLELNRLCTQLGIARGASEKESALSVDRDDRVTSDERG